ncbi:MULTISPECIES: sterol desaturase family protein [unclassified Arcicella]|uniref:sterol desaturase family protein n=1 Tax=unclassified Arcicella TaxID=2644986 RepID=UPI00285C4CCF|nr:MULTISPECIES: sterol desaturase family protein [unclassified Arcicella]MDR6564913.1 beta-carotene 3-hydroxylase [Arcicella sp. BE51]MDR6814703.1 beta-carotene 3-hydroxylase [Arcicella sp. BE140]MDR6826134.1 beta-carotene 3-hydroxylase [Arcicella sp. BE139]
MLIRLVLLFGTFLLMEGTAWFTHKYIMHGFMWRWHRSHHVHHNEVLEKNDLFAIVFSAVSIITIGLGNFVPELWYLFWVGMGVTLYGIFYFIFHDIIVHRRIKIKFVAKHPYLKRIMKAHYIHHKVHEREGAEAFGFLYAPKKYEDTRK